MRELGGFCSIKRASSIYNSLPYCHPEGLLYANAVIEILTSFSLEEFIEKCKNLEIKLGRHQSLNGVVAADIDVVFWNGMNMRYKETTRDYFQKGYIEMQLQ